MAKFKTLTLALSPRFATSKVRNLRLWWQAWRQPDSRRIVQQYFDREFYLAQNSDVARSGVDPLLHYIFIGFQEGRCPSLQFFAGRYIRQNPEVRRKHLNPLLHYAVHGVRDAGFTAGRPNSPPQVRENSKWTGGPLVSVVIPCFNYGKYLKEAVDSALNQTFSDLEIIVVEGGSTDARSLQFVSELESAGVPKTSFVYRGEPRLVGDNRNFGIRRARGRYICCLDADDLIRPIYIEIAVFLAETYGYDLVYPSFRAFGDREGVCPACETAFPDILDRNSVTTVALFRKSDWERVGGYRDWGLGDEYVPEDWDFWVRLLAHGCRPEYIQAPLMLYRVHSHGLTATGRIGSEKQRRAIQEANAGLALAASGKEPGEVSISHPWINLHRIDDRTGFLVVLPYISIGGAEALMRMVCGALSGNGYRVVVVTTLSPAASIQDASESFEKITPHVYDLPALFGHDEQRWLDFTKYLIQRYGIQIALMAGSTFLYRILPGLRREFSPLRIADQLFNHEVHFANNRAYATHIDVTIVPSELVRSKLIEAGERPERIAIIPHGIRLDDFRPGDPRPPAGCRLPPEAQGKLLIGFFGRLAEEKGADVFVKIVRHFRDDPRLYFCMTGDGPLRPQISRQIGAWKLRETLFAPGFVDDSRELMSLCDIVVVPSHLDGMPLVILEAQALGKAVVASALGSIPEVVLDRKTGFLCAPGDLEGFCRVIQELVTSPELRLNVGRAAAAFVRQRHDAARMLERYLEVFRKMESQNTRDGGIFSLRP